MPDGIKDLLTELKSRLVPLYGVHLKQVCLYGSHARGEAQQGSDIDVLIVLDRIERYGAEIDRTSELISDLSLKAGHSISRLFVTENDWQHRDTPFLVNVRREAIPA